MNEATSLSVPSTWLGDLAAEPADGDARSASHDVATALQIQALQIQARLDGVA